jgi:hypothetical protein
LGISDEGFEAAESGEFEVTAADSSRLQFFRK